MRKIYDLCRMSAVYAFFMCICLSVASCSKDDDDIGNDANIGNGNTTDMAVTGRISQISTSSVTIKGYINIDQAWAMLIQDFGVEYSKDAGFSQSSHQSVPGYTGREFSVLLYDLDPNTTYYYRTYVHQLSGMYNYGETMSFTTKNIQLSVSDISYTQAYISSDEFPISWEIANLYYSTDADGPFTEYVYWNDSYHDKGWNNTIYNCSCELRGLEPGTTYYFYCQNSMYQSDTISFKTKELPFDLSGATVKYTYSPDINSYTTSYGKTIDLTWVAGTFTVNITSNLGDQYKYGAFAVQGTSGVFELHKRLDNYTISDYLFYSTDTSNPYTVKFYYEAGWDSSRIVAISKLAQRGEATNAEIDELEILIDNLQYNYTTPYIQAFVEIDGELIFIGNTYSI